jgi:hypothetical protein
MRRGRTLFWVISGTIVAVVAVVIALIQVGSDPSPTAAAARSHHVSARPSAQASKSDPVVIPQASGTSSFSYLADQHPSGSLGELVDPGPVTISGSIYPKSIAFYCNDGDPAAFPQYKLKHNARSFQATIGLAAKWPPHFQAGVSILGDGHTLRLFSVSVLTPKTVDVNVTGLHVIQLECFSTGMTSSASGWNVEVSWGNARISGRR